MRKPISVRAMRRSIARLDRRRPITMEIPFRLVLERPLEIVNARPESATPKEGKGS